MAKSRTDADISLLAGSLSRAQQLEARRAERLAHRIAEADDDIWEAALSWARTGEMPTGPDIVGQTPVRLSKRFNPSQTFTALMAFREDPERARSAFRHPPDNLPRPRAT